MCIEQIIILRILEIYDQLEIGFGIAFELLMFRLEL